MQRLFLEALTYVRKLKLVEVQNTMRIKHFIISSCLTLTASARISFAIQDPLQGQGLGEFITNAVITILQPLALAAATLSAVVGIGYIIVSQGDPGKLKKGWQYLFYAIIGYAIVASARAIAGAFAPAG